MPAIFISYRRSDSEGEAGRLSDLLTSRFSGQSVFMDVDSIQPGRDFRRAIEESIQNCSVFLTIIGPGWLNAATPAGIRRLDAPNDYVRLEIAAALRRDTPVIPILVRGAHMPQPEQLPPEIQELAYRNSVELTHARWKSDLQVLIDALEPLLHQVNPAPRSAAPTPTTYLHATKPAPLHTPVSSQPIATRPGPSARRAAYTTPLPRSPFADTPSVYRSPEHPRTLPPAAAPLPVRATSPAPAYFPPAKTPAPLPIQPQVPQPTVQSQPGNLPVRSAEALSSHAEPQPAPLPAATLTAAVTDRVSKELAHFIGPIAEIVVKRAARRCSSESDLCDTVSHEIESARDRARFLEQCRK